MSENEEESGEKEAEPTGRMRALMTKLEQERDELRLKLHLAKADAKQEWDKLEDQFVDLRGRLDSAAEEAAQVKGEVSEAASGLVEKIREGYARIRERL